MKLITLRFWYYSLNSGYKVESKLKSYGAIFVRYNEDEHPYRICAGRVLIILNEKTVADIDKIIPVAMSSAAIGEILIGDKWLQLKNIN